MDMNMRGQIMKTKGMAGNITRGAGEQPEPARCVIRIPGHNNVEVPVIFKSWIYDEPEENIDAGPRHRPGADHRNDGVGKQEEHDYGFPMKSALIANDRTPDGKLVQAITTGRFRPKEGKKKEMIINLKSLKTPTPAKARRTKRIDIDWNPKLLDLIRLRVAQIHGCKWCERAHAKKLKARGETEARLRLLKDWRQKAIFSDREEAALNLAEALTRNPIKNVPGDVVRIVLLFFNESQMLCLILAILAANDWHYLRGFHQGKVTVRPPHE
jgi:AhpD family alkylhydroperoxidase